MRDAYTDIRENIMIYPVLLCAIASFSTMIGGIAVAFIKNMTTEVLAVFQGFAAGVMITISLVEMMPGSLSEFIHTSDNNIFFGTAVFVLILTGGWFAGIAISYIADRVCCVKKTMNGAGRISLVTTAVMVLHNLPEGMVTIFSGMEDAQMGLGMAFAVALHNIPEGVAVASSVICAGSTKGRGVAHSFVAGLSEFAGGVAAAVIFRNMLSAAFTATVFAAVSGVMMQVSLCELIPNGIKMSEKRYTVYGIAAGAAVIYCGLRLI